MLPSLDTGSGVRALGQDAGCLFLIYNERLHALFRRPDDWSLLSFQGAEFSPPLTMKYSWWPNIFIRQGHRVITVARGWGWNAKYGDTNYFIHTEEALSTGYDLPTT